MERLNAEALAALTSRNNVQLRTFPADLIAAARRQSADVLAELGARSEAARKVHDCYAAFRERTRRLVAHLAARRAGGAGGVACQRPRGVPQFPRPWTLLGRSATKARGAVQLRTARFRRRLAISIDFAALALLCREVRFEPGDLLRRKGVHYTDMYWIAEGSVGIHLDDNPTPRLIRDAGAPVGEIGFLRGSTADRDRDCAFAGPGPRAG